MKTILSFLALVFFTVCLLSSATYYVDGDDPSASNSNPGTLNLPWLTIQHASEQMVAGDTVFIRAAVYQENVITTNSGNTNDGPIVFVNYPGENFVLDGTSVGNSTGLRVFNSYITIEGWEISNWSDNGVWMSGASHVTFKNCKVHDVFYGIGISDSSHDFLLDHVETYNFTLYGVDVSPGTGSCYNGTFLNCISRNGRDPQQNVDGFALGHGDQHDFVFSNCTTYDVYDGFDISSRKSTLNSCLAYNCWNGGYKLWQDSVSLVNCIGFGSVGSNVELDWSGSPTTTEIVNCTFFGAGTYTVWVENQNDTLRMYNTILAGGDNIGLSFEQYSTANYFGDYNLFHNNDQSRAISVAYTDEFSLTDIANGLWTTYSGQDSHSIVVYDAANIFVDMVLHNFHLLSSSPAIDSASPAYAPSWDFDGNPRPFGTGFDIGAYEYQGVGVDEIQRSTTLRSIVFLVQNESLKLSFSLLKKAQVDLDIFSIDGRKLSNPISGELNPGEYQYNFNTHTINLDSQGLYFAVLNIGGKWFLTKILILN
ncbi:right-handed parallel beta-helix repeat-containing protein [candidate division WOR-3 bacterium]|nr:right-handed parallel beta-helix repeat-containing protein [candidate division WOR-3 bacterium]